MAVLLLLAITLVSFFAYLRSQSIDPLTFSVQKFFSDSSNVKQLNEPSKVFEIPYDSKEHPVYGVYSDYLVKCSKDGIRFLDKKGRELWSEGLPLNNPVVKTNGRELLVADIGGRDIYVLNGQSVHWKDKTDASIQNAEIGPGGYVTVITDSTRYNGEVRVYDGNGIELFRSVIANDFAVTAKISPQKDEMVIDLINASGVKSYTYLKFIDINGKELAGKSLPQETSLYPLIWYTGGKSLFAVGDGSIVSMDKDKNIQWEKKFTKIAGAGITGSGRLAVASIGSNGYELKLFSTSGKEYSSTQLKGDVRNISTFEGIVAVNGGREINFFSERGRNLGRFTSMSDITDVLFFSKYQAAVVTKSYIAVVDIG